MTDASPSEVLQAFCPDAMPKLSELKDGRRLVHYTSAVAALSILENRCFWMRNAILMNDFSEIAHGMECIKRAWASQAGKNLQTWLATKGLKEKFVTVFESQVPYLGNSSFLISLSEHDEAEDLYGRLSMWRAYGGKNRVGLILNPTIFLSQTDEVGPVTYPVRYLETSHFSEWFGSWANSLIENPFVDAIPDDELIDWLFYRFRTFALCTKHPGFSEEREWRVFYSPVTDNQSEWVHKTNKVIDQLPQEVIELTLKDAHDKGVSGLSPDGLINRIIIGPCEHSEPLRHALISAMLNAGINDPIAKISTSNIPLRT